MTKEKKQEETKQMDEKTIKNKQYTKTFYDKLDNKYKICIDCGQQYLYSNYSKHKKTKIHQIVSERLKTLTH